MPTVGTVYQPTTLGMPIQLSTKQHYYTASTKTPSISRPLVSPPSANSSVHTSAVPSLTSGSYGRSSTGDHESSNGPSQSVDLIDMMTDRLSNVVNPIALDRTLARQAHTSGELNAKQRELAELQALAQRRLRGTRANLADGMRAAKEVRRDLEWTQNRVSDLNTKAAHKYPSAYKQACAKYPSLNES